MYFLNALGSLKNLQSGPTFIYYVLCSNFFYTQIAPAFVSYKDFYYVHNNTDAFLDPRLRPDGSYQLGSVCPSFNPFVLLFRSFLGINSLVFSETQHDVRGPCGVVQK